MASLLGFGSYVPENKVSNVDLQAYMDTSDEWIQTRSGIKERRWIREGNKEFTGIKSHEMVYQASLKAFKDFQIDPSEIDAIVYATISPFDEMPGSGVRLPELLGRKAESIAVYEVRNQCSGFLYGLNLAETLVDSGQFRCVLVTGVEIQSSGLSLSTAGRNTTVLFADGCGVAFVGPSEADGKPKFLKIKLTSDGSFSDKLGITLPGFVKPNLISPEDFEGDALNTFPQMDGKLVFKMASVSMPAIIHQVLSETGHQLSDLKVVVPHQANQRIIDMLSADLGPAIRVFSNISHYGNTTAASIPLALSEAWQTGQIEKGDLVCLVSFGAGFSWGAALIQW